MYVVFLYLLILFSNTVTNLIGWHNGIKYIEVFQPSVYDQRKGTRV